MDDGTAPESELRVQTGVAEGRAVAIILIDGVDVLALQRTLRRRGGCEDPAGPGEFLPANPAGLLPPDSAALFPTTLPRHAMIGVCTCGEPGCASLWVQVRRSGDHVVWEPDPRTPAFGRTVEATWRFGLRQYLDAVDEAQQSTARWESRPIRIARELRRRRDDLDGFHMVDSVTGTVTTLLDAVAWPGQDYVLVTIAGDTGPRRLHLAVDDARTDQEIIAQLHSVDPKRRSAPVPVEPADEAADGAPSTPRRSDPEIVVGTKNFAEQRTLGELYAQALRANGFRVTLRANIGATRVVDDALAAGKIGMYPEYTGVICMQLAGLNGRPHSAEAAYDAARACEESRGNAMLAPSAFHCRECVVVRTEFAQRHGLSTIDDLTGIGHFDLGGPAPLATRFAGAGGLRQLYGLRDFTFTALGFGTGYAALDAREVDVVVANATDGQLAGDDYAALADDQQIFGFQQVAPVVAKSLLARLPDDFATVLNGVTDLLSQDAMISLNRATELEGIEPGVAAAAFLRASGPFA